MSGRVSRRWMRKLRARFEREAPVRAARRKKREQKEARARAEYQALKRQRWAARARLGSLGKAMLGAGVVPPNPLASAER